MIYGYQGDNVVVNTSLPQYRERSSAEVILMVFDVKAFSRDSTKKNTHKNKMSTQNEAFKHLTLSVRAHIKASGPFLVQRPIQKQNRF